MSMTLLAPLSSLRLSSTIAMTRGRTRGKYAYAHPTTMYSLHAHITCAMRIYRCMSPLTLPLSLPLHHTTVYAPLRFRSFWRLCGVVKVFEKSSI